MNRKEEYEALLSELEQTPAELGYTMTRVQARLRKKKTGRTLRVFGIPAASLGGLFMAFALLVNFSTPFAMACMNVPVLKELMEAVAFSDGLKAMVENGFVQSVGVTKGEDGLVQNVEVTAKEEGAQMTIHYLVYDGTEMNIFYTASYNGSAEIEIDPDYTNPDGSDLGTLSWSSGLPRSDGELSRMSVELHNGAEFPSEIKMRAEFHLLNGYYMEVEEVAPPADSGDEWENPAENRQEREPVAVLEFDLKLEEEFIKAKRVYEPQTQVDLDGRILVVEEVAVYPTGTRLVIREGEDNDAKLSHLKMWLEDGSGRRIEQGSSGGLISSGGAEDGTTTYFMDSVYFEPDDGLTLCISQARWLEEDNRTALLDLVDFEKSEGLPEGITLTGVERNGDDLRLTFLNQVTTSNFAGGWYDENGELQYFNQWGSIALGDEGYSGPPYEDYTYIWDYTGDTVEIKLHWSEMVTYDPVIRVPLG